MDLGAGYLPAGPVESTGTPAPETTDLTQWSCTISAPLSVPSLTTSARESSNLLRELSNLYSRVDLSRNPLALVI